MQRVFVQRENNRRRKCAETVNGGQKLFLNGWINERRRYSGSFFFFFLPFFSEAHFEEETASRGCNLVLSFESKIFEFLRIVEFLFIYWKRDFIIDNY